MATVELPTKLLTLQSAARCFRVPARWLREEANAGRVPHLKAGASLLFDREALERALIERARRAPEAARA
jgi:hypothetical protein